MDDSRVSQRLVNSRVSQPVMFPNLKILVYNLYYRDYACRTPLYDIHLVPYNSNSDTSKYMLKAK